MRWLRIACFASLCAAIFSTAAFAQDWASFKARFVFDGKPPARKELRVSQDEKKAAGLSAEHQILDESLIVDEKTKGIANILIWVIPDPDKPDVKMPIHESYKSAPAEHVIRIKQFAYAPRASIMRLGAKLIVENEDPIAHTSEHNAPRIKDYGRSPSDRERFEMEMETRFPATLRCLVHPHEKAYILVRDNPYFAVSNEKGEFEIKNLPMGEWRFKVWHEKAGHITDVKLGKSVQKWPKGEFKIKVEKVDFYLGDIMVPAKAFEK